LESCFPFTCYKDNGLQEHCTAAEKIMYRGSASFIDHCMLLWLQHLEALARHGSYAAQQRELRYNRKGLSASFSPGKPSDHQDLISILLIPSIRYFPFNGKEEIKIHLC